MNYIKRLEAENAALITERTMYRMLISDMREYLLSNKFHVDPTVQVRDVLYRLESGEQSYRHLLEI